MVMEGVISRNTAFKNIVNAHLPDPFQSGTIRTTMSVQASPSGCYESVAGP